MVRGGWRTYKKGGVRGEVLLVSFAPRWEYQLLHNRVKRGGSGEVVTRRE